MEDVKTELPIGVFLGDFFDIKGAAFDTLERAKHRTALHVAKTIVPALVLLRGF